MIIKRAMTTLVFAALAASGRDVAGHLTANRGSALPLARRVRP